MNKPNEIIIAILSVLLACAIIVAGIFTKQNNKLHKEIEQIRSEQAIMQ